MHDWSFGRVWIVPGRKTRQLDLDVVARQRRSAGSPTPNASTRLRMFSSAWFITVSDVPLGRCEDDRKTALEVESERGLQTPGDEPRRRRNHQDRDEADRQPEVAGSLHASSAPLIVRRNRASSCSAA